MAKLKVTNPFYALLVLVSISFGITALAYATSSGIAQRDPGAALDAIEKGEGLVAVMDRYGVTLLMAEVSLLAVTTVLAIGTDGYWTKRKQNQSEQEQIQRDKKQKNSDQKCQEASS